jgi:hypothetical protein
MATVQVALSGGYGHRSLHPCGLWWVHHHLPRAHAALFAHAAVRRSAASPVDVCGRVRLLGSGRLSLVRARSRVALNLGHRWAQPRTALPPRRHHPARLEALLLVPPALDLLPARPAPDPSDPSGCARKGERGCG